MSEPVVVQPKSNLNSDGAASLNAKKDGSSQAASTPVQVPEFVIPPHLLGHDPNNPHSLTDSPGRRMQKPRPGVKVPHRNLTSQIVTQDEIAQELFERSCRNYSFQELTGNNLYFSMKLSNRLANRITSPVASHSAIKEDADNNRNTLPNPDNGPIKDANELLSILEGSETNREQGSTTKERPKQETRLTSSKSPTSPYKFIKLYPELEKELALKQLSEFTKPRKKKESKLLEHKIRNKKGVEKMDKKGKKQITKQIVKSLKKSENNNVDKKSRRIAQIVAKGKPVRKRKLVPEPKVGLKKKRSVKSTNGDVASPALPVASAPTTTADVNLITEVPTAEHGPLPIVPPVKESKNIKKYVNKRLLSRSNSCSNLDDRALTNGTNSTDDVKLENGSGDVNVGNVNPKIKKVTPSKISDVNNSSKQKSGDVNIENDSANTSAAGGKKKSRTMREIERLLGDEGAINMLYSVEQKRTPGSTPSRRGILPSARRKKKDLLLKTRLVKNAVLRLSNSPSQMLGKTALRGGRRDSNLEAVIAASSKEEVAERKMSVDSGDSQVSASVLNSPVHSPSYVYSAKLSVPAEASRIIRRHSSSSSYSSRSNSPRRPSLDADKPFPSVSSPSSSPEKQTLDLETRKMLQPSSENNAEDTHVMNKSIPSLFHNNSSLKTSAINELSDRAARLSSMRYNKLLKPEELNAVLNLKKAVENKDNDTSLVFKKDMHSKLNAEISRAIKNKLMAAKLDEAKKMFESEQCFIKALTTGDSCSTTAAACISEPSTSAELINESPCIAAPLSPTATAASYSSLNKTLSPDSQKKREGDGEKPRSSIRQSTGTHSYKEISLRRYDHLVQIILTPISTKMKNAFNVQVFKEMISVLACLRKDESCRVVLLTSTGSAFCYGIDITTLMQPTPEKRKAAAVELVFSMREFIKSLATFNKPLIAGVHGAAVGLGVTMLPFFDMVFASDKATFHTPYARLGQVPEGAATLTLPQMLGNAVTSELLFGCRKLTASEALHFGLVTRILWPDRFQEELIPLIRGIATQSSQSMEATKALLRHSLCSKLDAALLSESHLLLQHWTSHECQNCFKQYLEEETPTMQK